MMTILFDARAAYLYPGTGLGTYSRQLLLQFLRSGLDLGEEIYYWRPHRRIGSAQLRKDLIRLANTLEKEPRFWAALMEKPVCERGVSLLHLPNNGLGGKPPAGAGLVVTIHDLIPYIMPETCSKEYLKIFTEQMPYVVERAARIIAVSNHTRLDLERTFDLDPQKILVIPEAPDPIYRPMGQQAVRAALREVYGLDSPFILYIGGFSPRKNLTALIRAYARVRLDLVCPHELVIIGKPGKGSYPDCRKLVSSLRLDRWVRFPGFVPTRMLPYFYNAASAFVYPSLYEGFGLPPLEAMACGTPTITSDSSSLPEVVGDGALRTASDPISLAQAIAEVVNQPQKAADLRRLALNRAGQFSWRRTAWLVAALYRDYLRYCY